jgi:iron complex outermembrane receptor protein
VIGAALLNESYDGRDIEGFDYTFTTPGLFTQLTADIDQNLSVTGSARVDQHSEYGTFFSPRGSALVRMGGPWTLRVSMGRGFFGPTPFTEETEVVGLNAMRPLTGVRAERAWGASMDLGGSLGAWELNMTAFTSQISDPIVVRDAGTGVPRVEMVSMDGYIVIRGGEFLARWHAEPFRVTTSYTFVKGAERYEAWILGSWTMPLVPRHQAGVVTSYEREGVMRAGLEVYYTGMQFLENDPYRFKSKPYFYIGALAERAFGSAKLFVNAENLLDVRQTDWDPLVRPFMGDGGRWTNDVWAPLDGFVLNAGVRLTLN